jgi:D-serine deaminase-like pyridoxal phosphate-dependent protein
MNKNYNFPIFTDRQQTIGQPVTDGDRIEFIVPHVCRTINLYDQLIGVRDGQVVDVWDV